MRHTYQKIWWLPLVLALTHCGGGSSDSGASASVGPTRFPGVYTLIATINVNIGGTVTVINDTSEVVVNPNGNVIVRQTDSECTLDVTVNADVMTYESRCTFTATTEDATAPCTLTFVSRAQISGTPGTTSLSGSFGPETLVCRGVAASFTGNLVGNRSAIDSSDDTADDTGDDT